VWGDGYYGGAGGVWEFWVAADGTAAGDCESVDRAKRDGGRMGDGGVGSGAALCDRVWGGDGVFRGEPGIAVFGRAMDGVGGVVRSGGVFLYAACSVAVVARDTVPVFVGDDVDWGGDSYILRRAADCGDGEEVWEVKEVEEVEEVKELSVLVEDAK